MIDWLGDARQRRLQKPEMKSPAQYSKEAPILG